MKHKTFGLFAGACTLVTLSLVLTGVRAWAAGNSAPDPPTFLSTPPNRLYPEGLLNELSEADGPYSVTVEYTDPDGRADIKNCYLRLAQNDIESPLLDSHRQTMMWFAPDGNLVQWGEEGQHLILDLDNKPPVVVVIPITNGYRITIKFQLNAGWKPSRNVDYYAWTLDQSGRDSVHVKKSPDVNAIYDNGIVIANAWTTDCVDLDDDGYCSEIRVHVNCDSSVCPRSIYNILYVREDDSTVTHSSIQTPIYSICNQNENDSTYLTVSDLSRGIYDFAWELYDDNDSDLQSLWFNQNHPDLSNIKMEPACRDLPGLQSGESIWICAYPKCSIPVHAGMVAKLKSRNIAHVFLELYGAAFTGHEDFIVAAHAEGITVHALIGGILPEADLIQGRVADLLAYNNEHPEASYDGVQLDIEYPAYNCKYCLNNPECDYLDCMENDLDGLGCGWCDEDYQLLLEAIEVPPPLIFSITVLSNRNTLKSTKGETSFYARLFQDTCLDLVIPQAYITATQGYSGGEPVFETYDWIADRTRAILADPLPSDAQVIVGLSSYDRVFDIPDGYEVNRVPREMSPNDDQCGSFAFDLTNEFSVPKLIEAGYPLEWVRHFNESGVSVYRFANADDHIDVVETTAEGVRRARQAVAAVAMEGKGYPQFVGTALWRYCATFNEFDAERRRSGRDEGLLDTDDGNHPIPGVCIRMVDFAQGVATLHVRLENLNAPEGVLGTDWSMGVHLRLEESSSETFQSAIEGDFDQAHALEVVGDEVVDNGDEIAGSRIVELRKSFFENPDNQVALSGEIKIAATGPFTLRYRSWMREKDSTCLCPECDDSEEPYIARWPDPGDICYHHPHPPHLLDYTTATTVVGCPWDIDGDGLIGLDDLHMLLDAWGACSDEECCTADTDGDGAVGINDFLDLLGNWGSCF